MTKWSRAWKALVRWWRDEPPPLLEDNSDFLSIAAKSLEQYDDCYCRRLNISPGMSSQAASIVLREGLQRPATLESEVRVLAITVERMLRFLQVENLQRREARIAERRTFPTHSRIRSWREVHKEKL